MRDKTLLSDIDLITITGKPEDVFGEMMDTYFRMEQVLATIEILADDEALKAVKKSREEIVKGEYDECLIEDLEKVLK